MGGVIPIQRKAVDGYLQQVVDLIDKHGWAVQGVFGQDHAWEAFSYTVGLTAEGLPELWIGSLGPTQSTPILNALAERLVTERALPADEPVDVGYSVPFRIRGPVEYSAAEAFVAGRLYDDANVTVLQVLFPDAAGVFPDEDGYDNARFPQRVLPLPEEVDE